MGLFLEKLGLINVGLGNYEKSKNTTQSIVFWVHCNLMVDVLKNIVSNLVRRKRKTFVDGMILI